MATPKFISERELLKSAGAQSPITVQVYRQPAKMADSNQVQVPRPSKPVSEALLNEKWDRAVSSMLIRSTLGLSFGVVFSVLLFKRRAWPAWVGLGFGAGRAWEEADHSFRRGDQPWRRNAQS